jgi:peptide/nickel transport system substrate-binding protein
MSKALVSRRSLLRAAAAATALSFPNILRAESQTTLRFIPVIDLTFLDPIYATAQVSRNHGFMVYDTLYGMNSVLEVSPQMVSGHTVSDDDRQWDLTLREGLYGMTASVCWRAIASRALGGGRRATVSVPN